MSEENKELVRRYYGEVFNARNVDAVGEFFADERLVQGIQRGCLAYFDSFPDLHVSIEELIAEGDKVVCRSVATGTHDGEYKGIAPTGRNVAIDGVDVFRVAGGRFVGYWCLANVAGAMRQITEEREPAAASPA